MWHRLVLFSNPFVQGVPEFLERIYWHHPIH
jgi:hypothetical protein